MTQRARSADGTTIAYEKTGSGPALIVVGGAFSIRQSAGALAPLLAVHLSVYAYDRRGRGGSSDASPYSPKREVEDLAALIEAAGGSAAVYGHSSGAVLALEAAASGLPITKLAAYEPPFTAETSETNANADWGESIQAALDAGDRDKAAALFMQGTGMDDPSIDGMRQAPWWQGMVDVAHTLPYDIALLGDASVPTERLHNIHVPTLLLYGSESPAWAGNAVNRIAEAIPDANTAVIQGQGHGADPGALAPKLLDFFA